MFLILKKPTNSALLFLAAGVHIAGTVAVFIIGRLQLLPSAFDRNGIAVGFARDGEGYLADAIELSSLIHSGNFGAWFAASFPAHTKIYSLAVAVFGPLTGANILACEPVNLICYLVIIYAIAKLGSELFQPRVGLLAALFVALWPTFLLHTTQPLKEPFFIAAFVTLILLLVRVIGSECDYRRAALSAFIGAGLLVFLWLIRPDFGVLYLATLMIAVILLFLKIIQTRKRALPFKWNIVALLVLLLTVVAVPRLVGRYWNPTPHPSLQQQTVENISTVRPPSRTARLSERIREGIAWSRYLFTRYDNPGSTIDADVRLDSWQAVFGYLPRALVVGLAAPFPNMWLATGRQVGRAGRIVAGIETLVMYLFQVLTLVALWKNRASVQVWFLAVGAVVGVTALAVVFANVGALYRMRYVFWMILVILGTEGAMQLWSLRTRSPDNLSISG